MDLAELDRLSLQRAWSNRDLAAAIGVTPETISAIYRQGAVSPDLFKRLTEKFAEREVQDAIQRVAVRLMGEVAA